MTDKELLYMKTIAEEGSISAAAKKLFMTQPALSLCLKSLEQEMGTPLFVRTPSGLKLTYAGECYYSMATDILDIYADYQQKLVDISQMRRGRIQIGMTRYIAAMLLPKVLPKFAEQYPLIDVFLSEKTSDEMVCEIAQRKADFALIHSMGDEKNERSGVMYEALSRDEFCIIMKQNLDMEKRAVRTTGYRYPVLDPKELEGYPFILERPNHKMRDVANDIFKRTNINPKVILETELFETAQRLARAGYGVTLINERYIREFMDMGECSIFSIPRKYKPFWHLTVIRPSGGYLPFASRELLKLIYEEETRR